jgi:hypothetical protein
MANPTRAHAAQTLHRRPGSRIVPAIPYRLSKTQPSARPITPEESSKGTPAPPPDLHPEQQEQEQEQRRQSDGRSKGHQEAIADTPPTPDSRASAHVIDNDAGAPRATNYTANPSNGHAVPASTSGGYSTWAVAHTVHVLSFADVKNQNRVNHRHEPKPATNGAHRKLTIPPYLPPPFVPSSKAGTQTPPVNGSDATYTPTHRTQFNGGAVASQTANGSPAASMTPHEADVDVHALPRPPPGFEPQHFASFFPAPAQYTPDGAPWHLPPHTVAPPDPAYQNGIDYHASHFCNGPQAFPAPYNGHFSPREAALAANGALTSHSQSPSKAQFETMPALDHADDQHPVAHPDIPPEERIESSFELAGYLSSQFGNPEFADINLHVSSPESVLFSLPVHGVVVRRSPIIAEAIRHSPPPSPSNRDARQVTVIARDPLATRDSLEEAIRVLYGAPLIRPQGFLYGLEPFMTSPSPEARRRMQQVLGYISAARTLQIPSMQTRGVHTARMLLRWDTVDLVLQYALSSDVEDPCATALTNHALAFIAYFFPVNFKLQTIAPELKDAPRLPTLVPAESRQPAHNPRLSKIRFGDAPPENEDEFQPSYPSLVLSTILLSLPLSLIEPLFNQAATHRIGWNDVVRQLREVVSERENRRQKALRSQANQARNGAMPLSNNLYVEEVVEQVEPSPLHPSGYRLTTKQT